jgi:uncharacterized protein YcnI
LRIPSAFSTLLAFLVLAPAAAGHVTVNPSEAAAESFARFDVRVPTERRDAETTEISVQIPEGLFFVSFQPKEGWKRTVEMQTLAEPVEIFGQQITERIASVTWTGGAIGPGEFDEFGLTARIPEGAGQELVFPAVQTYSSGEVVRWIGPPDSEEPAPRVTVLPAEEEGAAAGQEAAATEEQAAPAAPAEDDSGNGLTIVALVLAIAGLAAGLAALGMSLGRRRGS